MLGQVCSLAQAAVRDAPMTSRLHLLVLVLAVRYTSMNLTTGWAACFAWGSESALSAKRGYCPTSYGEAPCQFAVRVSRSWLQQR